MTPEEIHQAEDSYTEIPLIDAAKRLGVAWNPWMEDWFVSHSPRNQGNYAEGPWGDWVSLAVLILQDKLTAATHPELHALVAGLRAEDAEQKKPTLGDLQDRVKDLAL